MKTRALRWAYWIYDQTPVLHRVPWVRRKSGFILDMFKRARQQPVCVLAKTDEVREILSTSSDNFIDHPRRSITSLE